MNLSSPRIIKVGLTAALGLTLFLGSPSHLKAEEIENAVVNKNVTLSETLRSLESNFDQGYLKKRNDPREVHPLGKVSFGMEKDDSGTSQPVIYLKDCNTIVDKLYFSRVAGVKKIDSASSPGDSEHLLVLYAVPKINEEGNLDKEIYFYDFLVKDNLDDSANTFLSLAKQYASKNTPLSYEKSGCPSCGDQRSSLPLSNLQIDSLCTNGEDSLGKNYDVRTLGKVSYPLCVFDPEQSSEGLEGLTKNLNYLIGDNVIDGAIVFCGNADLLPADNCPSPVNEGNFILSFYRAKELADFVYQKDGDTLGVFTQIPYPKGTALNERSTRVYYVRFRNDDGVKP